MYRTSDATFVSASATDSITFSMAGCDPVRPRSWFSDERIFFSASVRPSSAAPPDRSMR
ncbi:MAG TPA: hypothetical protein VE093_01200 [Polyangiaceae bacterium]|nr:hypothetical protein [Polyangiaceae bacterium]